MKTRNAFAALALVLSAACIRQPTSTGIELAKRTEADNTYAQNISGCWANASLLPGATFDKVVDACLGPRALDADVRKSLGQSAAASSGDAQTLALMLPILQRMLEQQYGGLAGPSTDVGGRNVVFCTRQPCHN